MRVTEYQMMVNQIQIVEDLPCLRVFDPVDRSFCFDIEGPVVFVGQLIWAEDRILLLKLC